MVYHTSILAYIVHRMYTAGDLAENIVSRNELAREVMNMSLIPIVPYFPFMDEEKDRAQIMVCCKKLIEKCDIVVFRHDRLSIGCFEELRHAHRHLIPVFDRKILHENLKDTP